MKNHCIQRIVLTLYVGLFLVFNVRSQSDYIHVQSKQKAAFNIGIRGHYGFIIPHRVGMENLIQGHVKAGEISMEKQTSGNKSWQKSWKYPIVGFCFYGADLANRKELGYSLAVFPYLKFSPINQNRFRLSIRVGGGFGYVTKRFDTESNYKNVLIGSHANIIANLVGEAQWKLSDRIWISAGLGFMHYSNGAFRVPNLGINVPSMNAEFNYRIGQNPQRTIPSDTIPSVKYSATAFGSFGLKENYPVGSEKFPVYNLSLQFNRHFGYRSKIILMVDVFQNTSLEQRMSQDSVSYNGPTDITQIGFMLAYGMVVDKLTITVGQGIYARTKYKGDTHFYHRVGVTYDLTKRIGLRWMLKTHFFKADCFEFGIGYRFL